MSTRVPGVSAGTRATRDEQPGAGHHHHEPEDAHRHPDQRQTLRKDHPGDQCEQPDHEYHRGDEPAMPPHRTHLDGADETRIIAMQGPLDLIELALLELGKRHGSSRYLLHDPGSRGSLTYRDRYDSSSLSLMIWEVLSLVRWVAGDR